MLCNSVTTKGFDCRNSAFYTFVFSDIYHEKTDGKISHTPYCGAYSRDALASSVTLPMELSMAAAQTAGQLIPNENNVLLVSESGGQVTTSGGLKVETQAIDTVGRLDLLVISAIWRDPKRVLKRHPLLVPFIRGWRSQVLQSQR